MTLNTFHPILGEFKAWCLRVSICSSIPTSTVVFVSNFHSNSFYFIFTLSYDSFLTPLTPLTPTPPVSMSTLSVTQSKWPGPENMNIVIVLNNSVCVCVFLCNSQMDSLVVKQQHRGGQINLHWSTGKWVQSEKNPKTLLLIILSTFNLHAALYFTNRRGRNHPFHRVSADVIRMIPGPRLVSMMC